MQHDCSLMMAGEPHDIIAPMQGISRHSPSGLPLDFNIA